MPRFLTALIFTILTSNIFGKDLGVIGETFAVKEEDFVDYLKQQITNKKKEEILCFQEDLKIKYSHLLKEPKPINLPKAKKYNSHYYDPTIVLKEDILDHNNKVVIAKGTKYNPLNNFCYSKSLLFFDANDPKQLTWAENQNGETKWILINGSPLEVEKLKNREVYFDQNGILSNKLNIKNVPAKVSQEGSSLKIEEFYL
ncbi:conjugal transfer pilus assembly protein TraW [Candidatus Rubidus massiliensis]|nr:conjugal transfer pilus assembly protein TraW [Candidatus Rubidus massiliensis]